MRKAGDIIKELFRENFGLEFSALAPSAKLPSARLPTAGLPTETGHFSAGLFSSWTRIVAAVWSRVPFAERGSTVAERGDIPAVAEHTRIGELERGALLIEADHPGWIQILLTKQGELLSEVQKMYPDMNIRSISFRLSRE